MTNLVAAGAADFTGTYRCSRCEFEVDDRSTDELPVCPMCGHSEWQKVSAGYKADLGSATQHTSKDRQRKRNSTSGLVSEIERREEESDVESEPEWLSEEGKPVDGGLARLDLTF